MRIVADGLGFTNETKVDPSGRWLYVNETIARRLSPFAIRDRGELGPRETVAEFGEGTFPNGFEFDSEGGIRVASVVSTRLLRIAPDGSQTIILEDADPDAVASAERHLAEHRLSRADIDAGRHRTLGNLASVTFGGPDLKTVCWARCSVGASPPSARRSQARRRRTDATEAQEASAGCWDCSGPS